MRFSAACLALLFVLSLSAVSVIHLQRVSAETTSVKYYLQPGDPISVSNVQLGLHHGEDWFGKWNMTVFNTDTPTPNGPLIACSWCDFATRPLVNAHFFKSFKLHLYLRWPQCPYSLCPTCTYKNNTRISLAIGSAPADLSRIGFSYEDALRPTRPSGRPAVLDLALSGYQSDIGQEVSVAVNPGNRLMFHFGIRPTMLGEDAPCGVAGPYLMAHPTILFGDSEHASYIETDDVELQGEPIPEFPLPVLVLLSSLLVTYTISTRKARKKSG